MKLLHPIVLLLLSWMPVLAGSSRTDGGHIPPSRPAAPNPLIAQVVASMNEDSLRSAMEWLEAMGTRYMYAVNRREVASRIAGRFRGYGYTNVVLDSFKVPLVGFRYDSVWQYNVIAEITGKSAPSEIYVISAHHDDFCMPDPEVLPVPGADDNASGCAIALETARVLKLNGFQPEATVRFVTYAAEELVGYTEISGSMVHADRLHAASEDLRLHICNDMTAFTPGPGNKIWGVAEQTGPNAWAGQLTERSVALYSGLNMVTTPYPVSDSYHFRELGYAVAGFQEYGLSPYYHTRHDSVANCMTGLCLETARANCAILLNELLTPVPREPYSTSSSHCIRVNWKQTLNAGLHHFNIYRSLFPDSLFTLSGNVPATAFSWTDSAAEAGTLYYYRISSADAHGNESTLSNSTVNALSTRNRPLLVVKDTRGGLNNPPDSTVSAFYRQIFRDLPFDLTDPSAEDSLDISILGKYRRIFWLSNSFSDQTNSSIRRHHGDLLSWLRSGGKLFIAGFQPTFMLAGNTKFDRTFGPSDTLNMFYKIAGVERKPQACLNAVVPVTPGYPQVAADPAKCPAQLQGHLMNIESLLPATGATLVYQWGTGFDSLSAQGRMKGKPVGLEYMGDDYKLIVMTMPLYYADSAAAREIADYVANEKFREMTGTELLPALSREGITALIPNPARGSATLKFRTGTPGRVEWRVTGISGTILFRSSGVFPAGENMVQLHLEGFSPGIYMVVLKTGGSVAATKLAVF